MEYILVAVVVVIVGLGAFMYRTGKKASRGEQHDAHMQGDQTFHERGEDWDRDDPIGRGMSDKD